MKYYAGLDVSLKETFISIIDESGKIISEGSVESDVYALSSYLKKQDLKYELVGIESGQLSISLCKGLEKEGLAVICVDARHMAAALSARINKNDRNDARGIAQMLRAGLYKPVKVKSDESCQVKLLLGSRRQLVNTRQQLMGTIRGLLKIYGIKLGTQASFSSRVKKDIESLDETSRLSIQALLDGLEGVEKSLKTLDKKLGEMGRKDEDCIRLMTVPGVGVITALTYKVALDDPGRFATSETVGAYLGLTPRQYASGDVDRQGSISKMGPKECRTMLYEAAQTLLTRVKKKGKIKSWGLRIAKRKGFKKAAVAVARKLAVILHRIWVDKQEFCYQ